MWTSNNYITRCHRRLESIQFELLSVGHFESVRVQFQLQLESVGGQDASVRISLQTEGLQPSVTPG